MRVLLGSAQRAPLVALATIAGALTVLATSVLSQAAPLKVAPVVLAVIIAAVGYRTLLAWRTLLSTLMIVILFIPIRRYTFPGHLPFQLEPYRLLVAFITAGWVASLLTDPRVKARRTGLEAPLIAIAATTVASVIVNAGRIHQLNVQQDVSKKLTFFLSFFLVIYLVASLAKRRQDVEHLIRVLVSGGAVLSIFAIIESLTGYNFFNNLHRFFPILAHPDIPWTLAHPTGHLRVFASAEHPIALGAVFVMLVPFAFYLVRFASRKWLLAAAPLGLAVFATVSRTAIVMLLVVVIVFLRHRASDVKRLWPFIVPALLVVHFAVPGAIGSLKDGFFPKGGLIHQQSAGTGATGSGRLAHWGPGLHEWAKHPLVGQGFGTRIVDGPKPNAPILDDQWLGTLLDTGLLGAASWVWLFGRFIRRVGRAARRDRTDRGWLLTAFTASVAAFAWGTAFYDAFSFIQVTFLAFVLFGLGSPLLATMERTAPAHRRRLLRTAPAQS